MAQIALSIVGGVVGGFFGVPQLGMMAGGIVGGLLFPAKGQDVTIEGPRLTEYQVQTSTYGQPIPDVYGRMRIAGNVIWSAGIEEHRHVQREEAGGKGGGGGQTTTQISYTYTCSFAVGICEGPIDYLTRIWAYGKLIYDGRSDNEGPVAPRHPFTLYKGTETQSPSPVIEAIEGSGNVPAHRGLAYIVFEDFDLTNYGNRIPNLTFEVLKSGTLQYPYVNVNIEGDSVAWVNSCGAWVSPDREFIYVNFSGVSGRSVRKIDVASNSLMYSKLVENMQTDHPGMDSEGNFYISWLSGTDYLFAKVNEELNVISTGPVPTLRNTQWSNIAVSPGNLPWIFGMGGTTPSPTGCAICYRKSTLAQEQYYSFGYNYIARAIVVDEDGTGWCLVSYGIGGNNTYIHKLNPMTGVKTTYDITSILDADKIYTRLTYDSNTGYFWVGHHNEAKVYVLQYDEDSGFSRVHYFANYIAGDEDSFEIRNGKIWFQENLGGGNYNYVEIDSTSLEETRSYNYAAWIGGEARVFRIYDPISDAIWVMRTVLPLRMCKFLLDRVDPDAVLLSSIVSALCQETDLAESDIDVSELTDEVIGYVRDRQMTGRAAIEPLQAAFQFDAVESDTIKFIKRGNSSAATITEDDLGSHEEGSDPSSVLIQMRRQELELPRRLDVVYLDVNLDYQQNAQSASRLITESENVLTMTLPIVLSATQAKRIAEILLYNAWVERMNYEFFLPPKWSYLEPADVITLSIDSKTYLIRLTQLERGGMGVIRGSALAEDPTVYSSEAAGTYGEAPPVGVLDYPGSTTWYLIDCPLLRDQEEYINPYGFYLAVAGRYAAWHGAQIFKSIDEGISFSRILPVLNSSIMGTATEALGDCENPMTWDYNTLTVRLLTSDMELSGDTKINVLNGSNWFLLGSATIGWEICAFANATLNDDGSYTLDALLRGLRGTEWMVDQHISGDIFILLDASKIERLDMGSSELDAEYIYRAISFGMNFETGVNKTFTNTGQSAMPYAPTHIEGERDGDNDLTITWIRRARIDGDWRDYIDVPLDEDSEAYEVDIMSGSTVLRTIDSLSSPTCVYTATQQTADGLTPGDPVTVNVYQISAIVGRGFAGEATI